MTPGGRERTAPEFERLLQSAGLKMTRIIPTESPVAIVEAESAVTHGHMLADAEIALKQPMVQTAHVPAR